MADLASISLIHLAPRSGTSGVGDHADDFADAVAPHVAEVVPLRHGPPREDSIADIRRIRRAVRKAVEDRRGTPVVVHAELSGGSVGALWAIAGLDGVRRSATLHDPPRPVWYPYLTRGLARSRYLVHGAHLPLDRVTARMERRTMRDVAVFALSADGVAATVSAGIGASQAQSHLIIPSRPVLPQPATRPRAVGLFGHVYRGKGFQQLAAIREALHPEIGLVVAGRGTEALPPTPGVTILGAVEGSAEDEFFGSIRALLLPYERRFVYRQEVFPASSVLMRAVAYGTPSLSTRVGPLVASADAGATIAVAGDGAALAAAAPALVDVPEALEQAAHDLAAFAGRTTTDTAVAPYLEAWSR